MLVSLHVAQSLRKQRDFAYREVQDLAACGGLAGVDMAYEHHVHVFPAD